MYYKEDQGYEGWEEEQEPEEEHLLTGFLNWRDEFNSKCADRLYDTYKKFDAKADDKRKHRQLQDKLFQNSLRNEKLPVSEFIEYAKLCVRIERYDDLHLVPQKMFEQIKREEDWGKGYEALMKVLKFSKKTPKSGPQPLYQATGYTISTCIENMPVTDLKKQKCFEKAYDIVRQIAPHSNVAINLHTGILTYWSEDEPRPDDIGPKRSGRQAGTVWNWGRHL